MVKVFSPHQEQRGLWATLLLLLSCQAFAVSVSHDLSRGDNESFQEDGGYFELGFGVGAGVNPLVNDQDNGIEENIALTLAGGYRYHGWFVEANDNDIEGVALGYTFAQTPAWSVDFTLIVLDKSQGNGEDTSYSEDEAARDEWLMYRDRTYYGLGLRATGYWGNTFLQYRILNGLQNRGIYSSLRVGQTWQVRNWNFHAIAGLEYYSAKTADFFVGVSQRDATTRFPEYSPSESFVPSIELGATYPLSEHWISRTILSYGYLNSEFQRSPLVEEDNQSSAVLLFIYTF